MVVEVGGTIVGAKYSEYWWHYMMTMPEAVTCRALIKSDLAVTLDLERPALAPEIAPHARATYEWAIAREADYQGGARLNCSILRGHKASRLGSTHRREARHRTGAVPAVRMEVDGEPVSYLTRAPSRLSPIA